MFNVKHLYELSKITPRKHQNQIYDEQRNINSLRTRGSREMTMLRKNDDDEEQEEEDGKEKEIQKKKRSEKSVETKWR